MLEGIFADTTLTFPEIRAYPVEIQETSGVTIGSQSIYKYSLKSSDYPTLIIIDKISDSLGNTIPQGHYELALSDDRDFLIILETKNPIAIIPVFKVEEDKNAFNQTKKYKKIKKKIEKEREKTNKKRKEAGMTPDEDTIPSKASIEYVKDGNYYLIMYERGPIRAWGAIKSE